MKTVIRSTAVKAVPHIRLPNGYWNHPVYQKQLFDQIAKKMNIHNLDDWYKVSASDVFKMGGGALLSYHYNSSLYKALSSIYPDHDWKAWKFKQIPKGFWNNPQNIVDYFRWISEQLGITRLDEWVDIPRSLVELQGGYSLLQKFGSLSNLLKQLYPDYPWDNRFRNRKTIDPKHRKSKSQQILYRTLTTIFPSEDIKQNYKHPTLLFPLSNREMELDFYVPSWNIAFEYQGQQHYFLNPLCEPPEIFQERDLQKRQSCAAAGILLIEVPFWWNTSRDSLIATILNHSQVMSVWSSNQIEALKSVQVRKDAKPISSTIPPSITAIMRNRKQKTNSQSAYPFRAVQGSSKGGYPKCRGCGKIFNNRLELRLEIRGTFTDNTGSPVPTKYYACCDVQCLQKGRDAVVKRSTSRAYFPPFENKIAISNEVKLGKELPSLGIVEWITTD